MDDILPEYRAPKKTLVEMSHTERMAQLMRSLGSPAAVPTAATMVRLKEKELREAEQALEIARQLQARGVEQSVDGKA